MQNDRFNVAIGLVVAHAELLAGGPPRGAALTPPRSPDEMGSGGVRVAERSAEGFVAEVHVQRGAEPDTSPDREVFYELEVTWPADAEAPVIEERNRVPRAGFALALGQRYTELLESALGELTADEWRACEEQVRHIGPTGAAAFDMLESRVLAMRARAAA